MKATLLLSALLLALLLAPASAQDPERKQPAPDAKQLHVFAWTSKNDLRYTWVLPKGYDGKQRNLTVILHGTGLDYRWGHANNKPGVFRPDDVVVSVDGTSPNGQSRLFLGEKKDADAFEAFLAEMRKTFAVDRVFLYGHSQGSFFVCYFAGEHPDAVAGIVAHASGMWSGTKTPPALKKVAISFMHGSADPVVPYEQSIVARDSLEKAGFEFVHLRHLPNYNHWPNAVRATEELDWCQGMTTADPREALDCALRILRTKEADEYQWETVVGFAGARAILRRFDGKSSGAFANVSAEIAAEAKKWGAAIESAGDEQVAELKKDFGSKPQWKLDGKPWLGRILPMREDYRGVDSVEKYFAEIGYDKLVQGQQKAAGAIFDAWRKGDNPAPKVEAVLDNLGKAFLIDTWPHDFGEQLKTWKQQKVGGPKAAKKWDDVDNWQKGRESGWKAYMETWKKWKGPPAAGR
jgi:predicted esterase